MWDPYFVEVRASGPFPKSGPDYIEMSSIKPWVNFLQLFFY